MINERIFLGVLALTLSGLIILKGIMTGSADGTILLLSLPLGFGLLAPNKKKKVRRA